MYFFKPSWVLTSLLEVNSTLFVKILGYQTYFPVISCVNIGKNNDYDKYYITNGKIFCRKRNFN